MSIEKVWINKDDSGHNFILFNDNILYRRSVKKDHYFEVAQEVNQGKISDKFMGLPVSYMKHVEYRDDDKYLNISYNQESVDSFEIINNETRKEVFDFLKTQTDNKASGVEKPSVLSRIKKPLIALAVIGGIFAYVYSVISGMNQGYEYEVVGGRRGGPGLGGIVLGLAHLGLMKNALLFGPLALIAIYRMKKNLDNNSEIHYIEY